MHNGPTTIQITDDTTKIHCQAPGLTQYGQLYALWPSEACLPSAQTLNRHNQTEAVKSVSLPFHMAARLLVLACLCITVLTHKCTTIRRQLLLGIPQSVTDSFVLCPSLSVKYAGLGLGQLDIMTTQSLPVILLTNVVHVHQTLDAPGSWVT